MTPAGTVGVNPFCPHAHRGPRRMGSWKCSRSTTLCVVVGKQGSPALGLVVHVYRGTEVDSVVCTVTYPTQRMGFKRRSLHQLKTGRSQISPQLRARY